MEYIVPYTVPNRLHTPLPECASLDGEIGVRFDRFVYERITGKFAIDEIWREAEECFADQYDDEYAAGMWRGEFWGKLLLSAVRVCRMKNDPGLLEDIRASVYTMLSYQRADGYLSTYRNSESLFPPKPEDARRDVGWDCPYNWNVWGQKYTLWAMIEIAMLLDDPIVLNACVKMADFLVNQIHRIGCRMKDIGTMNGMAPCSIMKPMLVLYRLTGDTKYYEFCLDIAAEWEREDNEWPNLISNALSGVPVSAWYPREEGWYAKAYEMMSSLDGLCELYRCSGNERYLRALEVFWDVVKKHESNILGSVGYCEQFFEAASHPNAATEICDVIHWMRLSYELFSLTGQAKYMDAMEKAFLNAFLAGIYEDGQTGAFFVRSAGRHWTAEPQVQTKYQHCCINNAARGFTNAAESIIMADETGYYVNLYIPTRVRFDRTSFRISSGYVDNGNLSIILRDAPVGAKLHLRIPEWCPRIDVTIGGIPQEYAVENGYAVVEISAADMIVKVRFDMTPVVIDLPSDNIDLPETDYHRQRWCDSSLGLCGREQMLYHPMCVIRRGPLMLARSKRVGCTEEAMFSGETVFGKDRTCTARTIRHDRLLTACRVKLCCDGAEKEYVMCDYASAANRDLEDPWFFTMYV
ncbi:MAG: glycoside hydrolase family 127 protein [Clostridia bacterium]|nr:glycoside hydrolase family 127 protein [Clostridia bacterium]